VPIGLASHRSDIPLPNKRLELAGPPGRSAVDRLIDLEAEVETTNSLVLSRRPQLKRGR
jgi:hypothetical protein